MVRLCAWSQQKNEFFLIVFVGFRRLSGFYQKSIKAVRKKGFLVPRGLWPQRQHFLHFSLVRRLRDFCVENIWFLLIFVHACFGLRWNVSPGGEEFFFVL